jgi:hypothetical protein
VIDPTRAIVLDVWSLFTSWIAQQEKALQANGREHPLVSFVKKTSEALNEYAHGTIGPSELAQKNLQVAPSLKLVKEQE